MADSFPCNFSWGFAVSHLTWACDWHSRIEAQVKSFAMDYGGCDHKSNTQQKNYFQKYYDREERGGEEGDSGSKV